MTREIDGPGVRVGESMPARDNQVTHPVLARCAGFSDSSRRNGWLVVLHLVPLLNGVD